MNNINHKIGDHKLSDIDKLDRLIIKLYTNISINYLGLKNTSLKHLEIYCVKEDKLKLDLYGINNLPNIISLCFENLEIFNILNILNTYSHNIKFIELKNCYVHDINELKYYCSLHNIKLILYKLKISNVKLNKYSDYNISLIPLRHKY